MSDAGHTGRRAGRARRGAHPAGAAVGLRQDRHRRVRPRPGRAGRGDRLHRGHRPRARRARACGAGDRGLHRLSRDDGRAREDAAPAPLRGSARACATTKRTCRQRPSRGSSRWTSCASTSTRSSRPSPAATPRRGDHREHRHRRPDDDPRRGEEPRLRRGRRRPGRLRGRAGRAARVGRAPVAGDARAARGEAFAYTARYDAAISSWFAAAHPRGLSAAAGRGLREGDGAALRREPPPTRALTTRARAPPRTCWRAWRQLHGKELSFNNLLDLSSARELAEEFERARVRDRQAQQPLRLRDRARAPGKPTNAPSRAIPRAPTGV